jgi:hypothetical protein
MPHFLLTFGYASRPAVRIVIIEAPSMFQARMTALVRRFAPGVPFGEGHELSAKMMTSIPPEQIGRMDEHRSRRSIRPRAGGFDNPLPGRVLGRCFGRPRWARLDRYDR